MARNSFAETLNSTKVMIAGLKGLGENLPAGVQNTAATEMEGIIDALETLNNEQEKLKAELKTKTDELNRKLKELENIYSNVKKRVKLDISQSGWKAFGIEDKK